MKQDHGGPAAGHSHAVGGGLDAQARRILKTGLDELLRLTDGLEFRSLPPEKHPLPLARAVYGRTPSPQQVRDDVRARADSDPVSVLEKALVLLELYESNQDDMRELVPGDMPLVRDCFRSKRLNGWIAVLGDGDRGAIESAVKARWRFAFFSGPPRPTGLYLLLNMLARYAFVYGRIPRGEVHAMGHFIEDHCPGLLVCHGAMSDLELTLSLAAMKLGLPAVVPPDYPFALGRTLAAETLETIADAVVGFANIRRRLGTPEVPGYPDYCDPENQKEKIEPAVTWGDTDESFYLVRKGTVGQPGVEVRGRPDSRLGITVTIQGRPLDAFDLSFIERTIAAAPSMISGLGAQYANDRLVVNLADGLTLDPRRIGEVLLAAVRHEFPKLTQVHVELNFECDQLRKRAAEVRREKLARQHEIDTATEESVEMFCTCVGCSPFAPDHVCVLTPQRPPQCGRPYEKIKTGALYGYDDMSNIHHSRLHRDINSFGVTEKGRCIDSPAGEWEGVNQTVTRLSQGRTRRVQLHSLDEAPHTGCGCFRIIMFKTGRPRPGIGLMAAGYEGCAPDGRAWKDLHYELAGKQAPGLAGAPPSYLRSAKFLQAHDGWKSIVWVCPKVAAIMGDCLPEDVAVGDETAAG